MSIEAQLATKIPFAYETLGDALDRLPEDERLDLLARMRSHAESG